MGENNMNMNQTSKFSIQTKKRKEKIEYRELPQGQNNLFHYLCKPTKRGSKVIFHLHLILLQVNTF